MPDIQFIPECFAETEMVKMLFDITPRDVLNHADGIHSVSKALKKQDNRGFINIGFTDNDKRNLPPYFDEFHVVDQIENVVLKKHPHSNDYLIIVSPAIEEFLLTQLKQLGKTPLDFDLPNEFKLFRHKLKKHTIGFHEGYKRMLLELKNAGTSGFAFIKTKIEQLTG